MDGLLEYRTERSVSHQESADRGRPAHADSRRQRDRVQPSPAGNTLSYAKILTQATGAWDFELRVAGPKNGPS